jgi:leader peptidase (prepilin peptidase)/N-methyltransferase
MNSEVQPTDLFALLGTLYLIAVSIRLSIIDIRHHRLPNRIVLPAYPITIFGQIIASALGNDWLNLLSALGCALLSLVIGLVANRWASLGMGDVKLIGAIALSLGWFSFLAPLVSVVLAFVIACAVVLALVALRKTTMGSSFALGPYLLAGFVLTQMLTWSSYLGGFSPNFLM